MNKSLAFNVLPQRKIIHAAGGIIICLMADGLQPQPNVFCVSVVVNQRVCTQDETERRKEGNENVSVQEFRENTTADEK